MRTNIYACLFLSNTYVYKTVTACIYFFSSLRTHTLENEKKKNTGQFIYPIDLFRIACGRVSSDNAYQLNMLLIIKFRPINQYNINLLGDFFYVLTMFKENLTHG